MSRIRVVTVFLLHQLVPSVAFPRRFSEFQSLDPEPGQGTKTRKFRHREEHFLEDGSEYSLHWDVDTDPETLLELDLEHASGAKVLDCSPRHLAIQVPASIVSRLDRIQHVTSSEMHHRCGHLAGRPLYHRIEKVHQVVATPNVSNEGTVVVFHTKELQSVHDVFRHCRYNLRVMPGAVQDPERIKQRKQQRRLKGFMDLLKKEMNDLGDGSLGNLKMGSSLTPSEQNNDQSNSFFNLNTPEEDDRIHYTWNYMANSTESPEYKYTFSGGTAWIRFFKPYIDATVGFEMNVSSEIPQMFAAPDVTVHALTRSIADMDLDIGMAANFDKDQSSEVMNNILDEFNIPILSKMKKDGEAFMRPFVFHVGGTPVHITPGWSVDMKIFHIGRMKGTMRVGLKTKLLCQGYTDFNTASGAKSNFSAKMLNVSFTPPTWLLFTEHFQLGLELEPSVWLKGAFGGMDDMEMGFGIRPYLNISITQPEGSARVTDLAIFPFRAFGLPTGKVYSLKISANGQFKTTAKQMSTGALEFLNRVQTFDFGPIAEETLLKTPIEVAILDENDQVVATGNAVCTAIADGICIENPLEARFTVAGQDVVVQLVLAFQSNAVEILEQKMQSLSIRFPLVTIQSSADQILQLIQKDIDKAEVQLYRNGKTYSAKLRPKFSSAVQVLVSDDIWELGPSFLESWDLLDKEASIPKTDQLEMRSTLALVVNGKILAEGIVPQLQLPELKPAESLEDLDVHEQAAVTPTPCQVILYSALDHSSVVGTGQLELDLMPVDMGAYWIQPFEADTFYTERPYKFAWTTHGAVEGDYYGFQLRLVEIGHDGAMLSTVFNKSIEVECIKDEQVEVHRYHGSRIPCIFEYEVEGQPSYAGKDMIAIVEWSDAMDLPHHMASFPFTYTGSRRLLEEVGDWLDMVRPLRILQAITDFPQSAHDEGYIPEAEEAFQELQSHCSAEPLKYSAGAGINYVQVMKGMLLPLMGEMMMGDANSMAMSNGLNDYVTRPVPIWRLGEGDDEGHTLTDLLPKSVCAGGCCEGMMPGCQTTKVNPIDIKQIVFKFSRTYNWIEHVGPSARHIIAYGLMLLPTAIREAAAEEKALMNGTFEKPLAALFGERKRRLGTSSVVRTKLGGEFREVSESELDEDDFSITRSFDQLHVQIVETMHYPITDHVMRMLMENNAFRGLEDGREATEGPVRIIGYELRDSIREQASKLKVYRGPSLIEKFKQQRAPVPLNQVSRAGLRNNRKLFSPTAVGLGIGMVSLAAAVAAVVAAMRRHGYKAVSPTDALLTIE